MKRARGLWVFLVLAASALAGLSGSTASAADDEILRDLWLTVQARKQLLDDPELAQLNIGVKVSRRIATLWGPVPSAPLALRAEQRVRVLIELIAVQNRLIIVPDVPPLPVAPNGPQFLPDQLPPALPRPPFDLPAAPKTTALTAAPHAAVTSFSSPQTPSATALLPSDRRVRLPYLGTVQVPPGSR